MFTLLNTSSSFAGPARTTYQAKIVKPDGYPLEASSVNFKFTILDPAGTCILYSETYSAVNMGNTGGLISFSLGSGVKTYPASATTFEQVFSNITANLSCDAGGPVNYSPNANDSRKIVMQFHDGTGWQTLPAMAINAVPYAMYANEASKLDGKVASDFVQNTSLATCGAGEALSFNGATFSCLTVPVPQAVSGAAVVTALGYTPADGASVTTLTSSLASANATISSVSSTVASVSSTVFSVSSTVSSLSNTVSGISTTVSNLSASMAAMVSSQWVTSGTTIYYPNNYIGIGTSAPTANISFAGGLGTQNITVDRNSSGGGSGLQLRAGGAAVNATDANGGTLFLSSGLSTGMGYSQIIMRTMSGTASGNSDNVYINRLVVLGNGNIGMGTNTPATKLDVAGGVKIGTEASSCAASLAGTLRYNAGAVEYCNGTVWAAFGVSGAGLQSLNGSTSGTQNFTVGTTGTTLNISSTNGVHTFNIPLASAGSVTGGLLSNADYTTFMGKITSSAASIAQVLGYAPVSTTTLGNYLAKASNLSDLTNSATARTNLGVGYIGTLTSVDLGSADVSGTLAIARTPAYSGDVTKAAASNTLILSNSGVTAGTYTKVTVDAKGRVTSSSSLTNSDVVTALGYTPGAATSGVTSLNGSTSQTQTFATGTSGLAPAFNTAAGVHTLNIPLASAASVTGGLLSNADYTTFMGKITSSAASIAQVLGYTPASATQLGNYLAKASNLSDLTNSATARTNLGVGYIGTLTSVDLGSADVSGTLAIARTPAYSGDVTKAAASNTLILSNSGVTAGTYNKVTVDAKGRVTSSSALNVSDVTSALGYTPASATASTQWTTSGTSIFYSSGNVGVGTSNSATKLHLNGGNYADGQMRIETNNSASTIGVDFWHGGGGRRGFVGIRSTGSTLPTPAGASFYLWSDAFGSPMIFGTQDTERMRIDSSGLVGIGTTSATEKLTIAGNMNLLNPGAMVDRYINIAVNGGAEKSYIRFDQTAAPGPSNYWDIGGLSAGNLYDFGIESSGTRRLTIKFTGNVGIGTSTPMTKLDVSGGVRISMEAAACTASYTGTLRYNSGNVEYCNGTSWAAFGVATAGVTSLNGSTSQTQTFAVGTAGTAPAFNTAAGVHTLNIPLASAGSVTGGLLSNADYTTFMGKITSSAASIAQVLGYTPASATQLSNFLVKANNLSDLASSATARANLGLGTFATASTIDLGSASATGILSAARLPAFTGDVTSVSGSPTLTLSNSGVTAGTYNKVTVDAKGRVTSSSALSVGDVTTALGYTPASASASTQWTTSSTVIYYNTGSVGIGTADPQGPLHILSSSPNAVVLERSNNQNSHIQYKNTVGSVYAGLNPSGNFAIGPNLNLASSPYVTVQSGTGYVGIGAQNPTQQLTTTADALIGTGGYPAVYLRDTSWWIGLLKDSSTSWTDADSFVFNTPVGRPFVWQAGAASRTEGTPLMYLDTSGYLGLGTVSPTEKLDVNGNAYIRGGNIFTANDGATNVNNDYINYDDIATLGAGGVFTFQADTTRGASWTAPTAAIAAKAAYLSNSLAIGTTTPTRTLDVNGSINAAGMASEMFSFTVDGTSSGTWAIGSLSNNGTVVHVNFEMFVHNNSTIDALRFQASLPTYSNGTFYPNWQELPVAFGSTAWNGQKNYVIDVLRSSSSSGQPIYFRVRNKGGNGSSSTMKIRMTYNSDITFTRITHVNTVATAFNAGTAAAGGPVDGMYGALEYSFPVAIGQAWRPADNSGLFVKNSGYVGIGTSNPSVELEVSGTVKAAAYLYTSDRRLKKDIVTLPDALANVLKLRGVNFVWRNNNEKTMGFIAQEVEEVYPELVKTDKTTGFKAVQYGNIVAVLVEAIKQENKERVEAQNQCEVQLAEVKRSVASVEEKSAERMNKLEKENQDLKSRLEKLEKLLLKK